MSGTTRCSIVCSTNVELRQAFFKLESDPQFSLRDINDLLARGELRQMAGAISSNLDTTLKNRKSTYEIARKNGCFKGKS